MTETLTASTEMFDESPINDDTRKAFDEIIAAEFGTPDDTADQEALAPKAANEHAPFGMGLLVVESVGIEAAKHVASTNPNITWTPRNDGSGHEKIDSVTYNDAD